MVFGGLEVGLFVQQAAQVQVRISVVGVELEGAPVGVDGLVRGGHLELGGELEPVLGFQVFGAVARRGGGAAGERLGLLGQGRDAEIDERLARPCRLP